QDGSIHLGDFGIAVVEEAGGPVLPTRTARGLEGVRGPTGTLAFLAPEQARGEPATPATDIYQLGLVLYEMVTGVPGRDLRGLRAWEAMGEVAKGEVNLDLVPAAWRPVISRALDPAPSRRFGSAAEMRAALLEGPAAHVGWERARPSTR
ncbi:MAG: hypothetical protein R3185_01825, partial [Candidatus Thermoplasmatota archaeon]|nr:hypothetical protein [Candidatus Thermoplasmatota archaeon]